MSRFVLSLFCQAQTIRGKESVFSVIDGDSGFAGKLMRQWRRLLGKVFPEDQHVQASQESTFHAGSIKSRPVRQTAVGNDPAFGFGGGTRDSSYRYYSLPSVGNPVKLAVIPFVYYDTEAHKQEALSAIASGGASNLPSLEALEDVLFAENLASSSHSEEALKFSPRGSMAQLLNEASSGKMKLTGKVFDFRSINLNSGSQFQGWYIPEDPYSPLGSSLRAQQAAEEAFGALAADSSALASLSTFDNPDHWDASQSADGISSGIPSNPDQYFDCILFLVAQHGAMAMGAHGYFVTEDLSISVAGKPVRSIVLAQAHPGAGGLSAQLSLDTILHELGHAMGLPDTYDKYDDYPSPVLQGTFTAEHGYNPWTANELSQIAFESNMVDNLKLYNGMNSELTGFSGFEKFLLGWIDNVVEVPFNTIEQTVTLLPVYDGELLVLHASYQTGSVYSDWPLFVGSPADKYLFIENRGYKPGIHFEYGQQNSEQSGPGLYGQWVDTSRAGEFWLDDYIDLTHYNNLYRQCYFDTLIKPGSSLHTRTFGGGQSYLTPYTGIIGPGQFFETAMPASGPALVCFNSPFEREDGSVDLRVYSQNPAQVFLEKVETELVWDSQQAADSFRIRSYFWDSEFSHSWPEAPGSYVPSFELSIEKLLSQGGNVDPAFTPIVSGEFNENFEIVESVSTLLDGDLPGIKYFRATVENLNPRSFRSTSKKRASYEFALNLREPINFPNETPYVLDFDQADARSMFLPDTAGPQGSIWQFIEDKQVSPVQTVAYCGRVDESQNPIGYEPNLDSSLLGDIPLKFTGSTTKFITLQMWHQIEKMVPFDSVNWEPVGNLEPADGLQVRGERIVLELRRFADSQAEMGWYEVPFDSHAPSGQSSGYANYKCRLTEGFLSQPGLDVLNADGSGQKLAQLRLRFISDDSVQHKGVFVRQITLGDT